MIWIFAVVLIVAVSLAGWRQGAIRAAFAFVGILFAALLAVPIGHLFHPLLHHLGVTNPVTAWAVSPVIGFIVASIPLKVAGHHVHNRVEHYYKYKAGDLRLALWSRLNTRLGICIGLLNGSAYFILVSFFIFNIAYWTTQAASASTTQPILVRLVNSLGDGLQDSGFSRTADAVGTISPNFYKLADLTGLLMQNPKLGPRFAEYPGLVPLWHRDDMQQIVSDPMVTNALSSGESLSEVFKTESVHGLIANKDLTKALTDTIVTNLSDLQTYLTTGKSAKFGGEPILGNWQFDAPVTLAWFRQDQPKINPNEMRAVRMLWSQAYAQTTLLMTADGQVFVQNFPKFNAQTQPNQQPFDLQNLKGDWSRDGTNYTVHLTLNGQDKYMTATTDGVQMKIKDGRNPLIFDHVN